jgi:DNA-binding response OmpR family regulator
MQLTNVVLLQSDPEIARTLSASLANSFPAVQLTQSMSELRRAAAKPQPPIMIVDLETATFSDVASLKRDFRATRIICNHRIADEEMWTRALTAGAEDCCPSSDTRGIVDSAVAQQQTAAGVAA